MLVELVTSTEALINVVPRGKIFTSTKLGLVKANLSTCHIIISTRLLEHGIKLVEESWHDLGVLVAERAQLTRDLGQVIRTEEYIRRRIETVVQVLSYFVEAPRLVHLA